MRISASSDGETLHTNDMSKTTSVILHATRPVYTLMGLFRICRGDINHALDPPFRPHPVTPSLRLRALPLYYPGLQR